MQDGSKATLKTAAAQIDFESNEGFSVDVWGPAAWHFIRCASLNFPVLPSDKKKRDYMQFMESLGKVLPCGVCRDNYSTNFENAELNLPKTYKTRESFARAVNNLERLVFEETKNNGKKGAPMPTFEKTHELYSELRATASDGRSCKNKKRLLMHIVDATKYQGLPSLTDATADSGRRRLHRSLVYCPPSS